MTCLMIIWVAAVSAVVVFPPAVAAVSKNFINESMPMMRPTFVINFDMSSVICQHSADPTDLHLHPISILCDGEQDCFKNPAMHDESFPYCGGRCSPACNPVHGACLNDGTLSHCYCNSGQQGPDCNQSDENECKKKPCHWLAKCTNTVGSYFCTCFPGFKGDGIDACVDIDECAIGTANCPPNSDCINLPGTYFCNCTEGFVPDGSPMSQCIDVDECEMGIANCREGYQCQNLLGSYRCVLDCESGYQLIDGVCKDVNECDSQNICPARAICTNWPGSYQCSCEPGFTGDGTICSPLTDCSVDESICDRHAFCIASLKMCFCSTGYIGDGFSCFDVNECAAVNPCNVNQRCVNTFGSYLCCDTNQTDSQCRRAFDLVCGEGCGSNAYCVDNACNCNEGHYGDPYTGCHEDTRSMTTTLSPSLTFSPPKNVCNFGNGLSVSCDPVQGQVCSALSETCICKPGYFDWNDGRGCVDINECELVGSCAEGAGEWCVNTEGSFHCCSDQRPLTSLCHGLIIAPNMKGSLVLKPDSNVTTIENSTNVIIQLIPSTTPNPDVSTSSSTSTTAKTEEILITTTKSSNELGLTSITTLLDFSGSETTTTTTTKEPAKETTQQNIIISSTNGILFNTSTSAEGGNLTPASETRGWYCNRTEDCGVDGRCDLSSGLCDCRSGFTGDPPTTPCRDIDECQLSIDNCPTSSRCTNFVGGFACDCPLGFRQDPSTRECEDINECEDLDPCHRHASCKNTPLGSYTCTCNEGYDGNGYNCFSMGLRVCTEEESASNCGLYHECHANVTTGAVQCSPGCATGFELNIDGSCSDVDECLNPAQCDSNANCLNLPGGYRCKCKSGWEGDGKRCWDINECRQSAALCHPQANCENLPGNYKCNCPEGWFGDGRLSCWPPGNLLCESISCGVGAACLSTADNQGTCVCRDGYRYSNASGFCEDVNECLEDRSHCSEVSTKCVNVPGSYYCQCKDGFTGSGDLCQDVDECSLGYNDCDPNANCINTAGSYTCECSKGFTGDGRSCSQLLKKDDDCPKFWIDACGKRNRQCLVVPMELSGNLDANLEDESSFNIVNHEPSCAACYPGYKSTGVLCEDINECTELEKSPCDPNAVCFNTIGLFMCKCMPGFIGDGFTCSSENPTTNKTTPIITTLMTNCANPDLNNCNPNADCIDIGVGQYDCVCREGFLGDGLHCDALCPGGQLPNVIGNSGPCQNSVADCPSDFTCVRGFCCPNLMEKGESTVSPPITKNPLSSTEEANSINSASSTVKATSSSSSTSTTSSSSASITTREPIVLISSTISTTKEEPSTSSSSSSLEPEVISSTTPSQLEKISTPTSTQPSTRTSTNIQPSPTPSAVQSTTTDSTNSTSVGLKESSTVSSSKAGSTSTTTSSTTIATTPTAKNQTESVVSKSVTTCREDMSLCHPLADCLPVLGECRCRLGYVGDGRNSCEAEPKDCILNLNLCHSRADCDPASRRCVCREGYNGNGEVLCIADPKDCALDPGICSVHAECIDRRCSCFEKYTGDGISCVPLEPPVEKPSITFFSCTQCHRQAICLENEQRCECNPGYFGNGERCIPDYDDCILFKNLCHTNGICVKEERRCKCAVGYFGDGKFCTRVTPEDGTECRIPGTSTKIICHPEARCDGRQGKCVCRQGYSGDGVNTCLPIDGSANLIGRDCRNKPDMCNENADCRPAPLPSTVPAAFDAGYVCVCSEGYNGNGIICTVHTETIIKPKSEEKLVTSEPMLIITREESTTDNPPPTPTDSLITSTDSSSSSVAPPTAPSTDRIRTEAPKVPPSPTTTTETTSLKPSILIGVVEVESTSKPPPTKTSTAAPLELANSTKPSSTEDPIDKVVTPPLSSLTTTVPSALKQTDPPVIESTTEDPLNNDPCDSNPCSANADCVAFGGTLQCFCWDGYKGDGLTCLDIDECAMGNDSCHSDAECLNTEGDHTCLCREGFRGDGRLSCIPETEPQEIDVGCEQDGITLILRDPAGFRGKMFVQTQSENPYCSQDFVNASLPNSGEYRFKAAFKDCNIVHESGDTYMVMVVVQKHHLFITGDADAYKLRCTYPTATRTIMSHYNVSELSPVDHLEKVGVESNCDLRITDPSSGSEGQQQVLTEANIGDTIRLEIHARPKNVYGVIPRNCRAVNMDTGEIYSLSDENGCPVDSNLFPAFKYPSENEFGWAWADFMSFKWPDSFQLRFQCQCFTCFRTECRKPNCSNLEPLQLIQPLPITTEDNESNQRDSEPIRIEYTDRIRSNSLILSSSSTNDKNEDKEGGLVTEVFQFGNDTTTFSPVLLIRDSEENEQAERQYKKWLLQSKAPSTSYYVEETPLNHHPFDWGMSGDDDICVPGLPFIVAGLIAFLSSITATAITAYRVLRKESSKSTPFPSIHHSAGLHHVSPINNNVYNNKNSHLYINYQQRLPPPQLPLQHPQQQMLRPREFDCASWISSAFSAPTNPPKNRESGGDEPTERIHGTVVSHSWWRSKRRNRPSATSSAFSASPTSVSASKTRNEKQMISRPS